MRRSSLAFFLDRAAADFSAFTMATSEGTVLYSRSKDAAEAGLLPHAIEIVEKYMPLGAGDVVLIKDSFAGGPGRDRLAMITAWNTGNDLEPKWLVATVLHHPSLQKLKLPPVPLRINGEMNAAVLEGLGPAREILEQTDRKLSSAREIFERKGIREHFSRKALSEVTKREQAWMIAWLSELPEGEASVEIPIPTGETIRMRWHNDGKHLSIDLSGTSNSFQLRLPFSATCGLIWTTLRERLGLTPVVDTFSADLFPVTVPNGCFLNATNGDCERGLVEIAPWIQWAVELLMHKWDRRRARGLVNPFDIHARLEFSADSILDLNLPTGSPSLPDVEGTTFWRQRLGQHHIGVETIERNWPVRVLRVDEKTAAVTGSKFSGGKGLHFQMELTKSAKFRWNGGVPPKAKFEKHQSPPVGSEVKLLRDGEERLLAPYQDFELKAGDQLTLLSGSGGGIL